MKLPFSKSIFCILVIVTVGCGTSQTASEFNNVISSASNKEYSVLWQQTAAEYTALCYQAFNIAQARLKGKEVDELAGESPLAIVMDLDETVLDNSPYNGYLTLSNQKFDEKSWRKWVHKSEAELVPGAKEFIDFTKKAGITVFYISNRREDEMSFTVQNLQTKGIDIDPNNILLRNDDKSKVERRDRVLRKYEIAMLIGDNLADFHNAFEAELTISQRKEQVKEFSKEFGKKFIILPNVMYGNWEGTLKLRNSNSIENQNLDGNLKYIQSF